MTYYILKTNRFNTAKPGRPERTLFLLKKRDVPLSEQANIVRLNCSSIKRVNGISRLMMFITMNTANELHVIQPYIIKRLTWNEAVNIFGFDYDNETSEEDCSSGKNSPMIDGSIYSIIM